MKVKFLYFFKIIFFSFYLSINLILTKTNANDIKIKLDPLKVIYGQEVRLSINTSNNFSSIEIILSNSRKILLDKIKNNYWNKDILVSGEPFKNGENNIKILFYNNNNLIYEIPYSITINQKQDIKNNDFDGNISQIAKDDIADINIKVSDLKNNIDQLEFEKNDLEKQYQDLQSELKKIKKNNLSEEEIELKNKELANLANELELKKKSIANFLKLLEKKEKLLERTFEKLEKQKNANKIEKERIEQEKQNLSYSKSQITIAQEHIMQERGVLRDKENTLKFMENEIDKNKKELAESQIALNIDRKEFDKIQKKLSEERKKIEMEQKLITEKQLSINSTKDNLSKQSLSLKLERESLNSKIAELKDSDHRMKTILNREMSALLEKEKDLQKNIVSFDKKIENFKKSKNSFLKIKEKFQKENIINNNLREKLNEREKEIAFKESEIIYKQSLQEDLKKMFQNDINQLKNDYMIGNKYQSELIFELESQMSKLTNATNSARKNSELIYKQYLNLNAKNSNLKSRLDNIIKTDYRYGIMPFIGTSLSSNNQNTLFGINGYFFYDYKYCYSLSLVSINHSKITENSHTNTFQNKLIPSINGHYYLNPFDHLSMNVGLGISQGLESSNLKLIPSIGIKYNLENTPYFYNFNISKLDDLTIKMGFAKYFKRVIKNKRLEKNLFEYQKDKPILLTFNSSKIAVIASGKKTPYLNINNKHWAYSDYLTLLRYNLLPSSFFKNKPNSILSTVNAIDLISLAYNSYKYQDKCLIKYNISGHTSAYKISIKIINKNNQIIRTLEKNEFIKSNDNLLYWDQKDDLGNQVPSGSYLVSISLTPIIELIDESIEDSVLVTIETPTNSDFNNNEVNNYQFEIRKKLKELNILDKNIINKQKNISRIDFMIALTNIIINYDKSILYRSDIIRPNYEDYHLLSLNQQRKINVFAYCLEPGTTNKLIRPNDFITQAEAVVLINRFIRWQNINLK